MASEALEQLAADVEFSAVLHAIERDINMADYLEALEWIAAQPRSERERAEAVVKLTEYLLDRFKTSRWPTHVNLPRFLGWTVQ